MRITFDEHTRNVDKTTNEYGRNRTKETKRSDCFALDISGMAMDNTIYGTQGRTAGDVMREAAAIDADVICDYMTVMSNSVSEEDFARLQKEGCSPMNTEVKEVVTIVDKIKAELAKAGVEVIGYTDTLDMDTLTEIAGSESYARAIEKAFKEADVPLTEQNVISAVNAMQKAKELSAPSEGAQRYMVDNRLEPVIDDLYLAEFSGADRNYRQAKGYYQEETSGYYAKRADTADMESLRTQVERILVREGIEITEENFKKAEFLIQNGIPLTGRNMELLTQIRDTDFPVGEERVWKAVATALAEGKTAGKGNLYDNTSVYEKAAAADNSVDELLLEAKESGNVTRYRQLQEIRLMMTAEANVKLLKSGFSIDTGNLEALVEALKNLEQQQAEQLFGSSANPVSDYALYKESVAKTEKIPYLPAAVVGMAAGRLKEVGVNFLYEEGLALEKTYKEAERRYETLMTVPRRDLGDNIQTAFQNVDDILESLGMELTKENRRAVRILGYNSTEITDENIQKVKTADRVIQRVIKKLTPSKVLGMIRDEINPLETSLADIESYLDGSQTYEEEAEKYSKYLYHLEQSGNITPEEKESYIGIYRMLRQIEKTDGAVVGQLLESGAPITFANLLRAVHSSRAKGMDVSVDDKFGGLERLNVRGISITEQIAAGYTKGLTDELVKETDSSGYDRERLQEMRTLSEIESSVVHTLEQLELPITADYLLAAAARKEEQGNGIRKLWQKRFAAEELPEAMKQINRWEEEMSDFDSARRVYGGYMEQLQNMAEELTFNMADTAIDVREMQLIHKQLHIAGAAAVNEEYDIPVLLEDEITTVHLTLRRGNDESGRVTVTMESGKYGKVSADMILQEQKVSGFMTVETQEVRETLQQTAALFSKRVQESGFTAEEFPILVGNRMGEVTEISGRTADRKVSTPDLYQLAKTFIGSLKSVLV